MCQHYDYLVTTNIADLTCDAPVVMVDGTVPQWTPRVIDFHFDHHRIGGAPIQLLEIPEYTRIPDNECCMPRLHSSKERNGW